MPYKYIIGDKHWRLRPHDKVIGGLRFDRDSIFFCLLLSISFVSCPPCSL